MTKGTRTALALLVLAQGLIGCESSRLPLAPSPASQVTQEPPPSQQVYTLTPSSNTVAPGGELRVSWTASRGGLGDWIGLFKVGAAPCDHGWSEYTRGATSGTLTLSAPTQSGEYEFRYLPNNDCVVTARSSPVTVSTDG